MEVSIDPTQNMGVNTNNNEQREYRQASLARSYTFDQKDQPFLQQLKQALAGLNISERTTLDEVHTFLVGQYFNPVGHRTPVRDHQERNCVASGAPDPGCLQDAKNFVERVIADADIYSANIIAQHLDWACEPFAWAGASVTSIGSLIFGQQTCERRTNWLGVLLCPRAGHDWHVRAFRVFTKANSLCHRTGPSENNHNRLDIEFESRSYTLPQIR